MIKLGALVFVGGWIYFVHGLGVLNLVLFFAGKYPNICK